MSFSTKENVCYIKDKESNEEKVKFLFQKGHNTAISEEKGQHVLAHADQFRFRIESKDVEMEEELGNGGDLRSQQWNIAGYGRKR